MDKQMKQYLYSLLNWSKEVQEKVKQAHMSKKNFQKWNNEMEDWKGKIEAYLKEDKEISEEQLQALQNQGQEIIYSLTKYFDKNQRKEAIAIGEHQLPPLPYDYKALEPYISEEIMKLHHDVHHKGYVEGLNKAELKLQELRNTNNNALIKHWLREQAFNGSGHFLHTIFWNNMSPNGGEAPSGDLLNQINTDFGSYKKFKQQFSDAALSVEGVGWAILVWEMRSGRLAIQTTEKHQIFALWDVIPLLVLDVWEHAYYLQYQTKKKDYVENWWNVVNWDDVQTRFKKAKKMKWMLT